VNVSKLDKNERWVRTLCLAECSWIDEIPKSPVEIDLVAPIHPSVADGDWDHLTESGKCERCGALVISVAKRAVCPVCESMVPCT
jgi:hypothetical protein